MFIEYPLFAKHDYNCWVIHQSHFNILLLEESLTQLVVCIGKLEYAQISMLSLLCQITLTIFHLLSIWKMSFNMTIMRTKMTQNGKWIVTPRFASSFGNYTNLYSRRPGTVERLPNLESDGLGASQLHNLWKLLHHFESPFLSYPKNRAQESLPYLSLVWLWRKMK